MDVSFHQPEDADTLCEWVRRESNAKQRGRELHDAVAITLLGVRLPPDQPIECLRVVGAMKGDIHVGSPKGGADKTERDGGEELLVEIGGLYRRLKKVWGDGAFSGEWLMRVAMRLGRVIEIVKRNDDLKGFSVLPKRWIVERTFAWLDRYRRLSKYYQSLASSSVVMIHLAMINLMVHRIKPG